MKLFVLAIDSLDRTLLARFAPHLPAFTRLLHLAPPLPLRSTFPPDSDTAWATIHTGLNPAQHAVLRFVDPLQKSYHILNAPGNAAFNAGLHGRAFWDILTRHGYSTCAVFPHLAYPLDPSPHPPESLSPDCRISYLTARSPTGELQSSPPRLLDLYPSPLTPSSPGLPPPTPAARFRYARRLNDLAASDAEFALRLLRLHDYDLFFVYFSTLDATSHFFWTDDPLPASPLLDAYRLYDSLLASFLTAIDPSTPFLLLSDHGHGPRPRCLFNLNELLRRSGFLAARNLHRSPHQLLAHRSKRLALRLVNRFALARPAAALMRRFPRFLNSFTRPPTIDWDRTFAYATDLSGIKAYSYGGIRLNPALLPSHRYEETRSEIIRLLQRACTLPEGDSKGAPDGDSLIRFVLPREELLQGPHLHLYPDILIQLIDGYGLGWGVNLPLFTSADAHNLVPGSHRGDTGVFVYRGDRPLRTDLSTVDLLDITPSILDLFGIPPAFPYDGDSIFSPNAS